MALSRSSAVFSLPLRVKTYTCHQCRALHQTSAAIAERRVPSPTPFVPDVQTFLTLIGRKTSQHAAKIPSWEALFTLSGASLREAGIEPARDRRYILWWRDRYRNGLGGIGHDLKKVKDGIAELQVAETEDHRIASKAASLMKGVKMRKVIVNVDPTVSLLSKEEIEQLDKEAKAARLARVILPSEDVQNLQGFHIAQGDMIGGTGVEAVKGHPGIATLKVREGLWEVRRGHKVDGGERRKAEVRYKRMVAERKNAR